MKWKMKRWMWIASGFAALLLGGAIYAFATGGGGSAEILTDVVKRGELQQTVEATGSLESVDKVDLSFDTSGSLAVVFARVGQTVQAGDRLAELEAGERAAEYDQAVQAVAQAEANLDQKYAGATLEEVAVADAGISVAQASLSAATTDLLSAQADLTLTIASETANVAAAENEFSQTVAENVVRSNDASVDLQNALVDATIASRAALSEADEILGIDNTLANNAFENVLSVLDQQALTDAENAYNEATESRDVAENLAYALGSSPSDAEMDVAYTAADQALQDTSLTLLYTRRVLDATAVDTVEFSLTDLSAAKTEIDAERNAVQASQEALSVAKANHDTVSVENTSRQTTAEDALAQAQTQEDSAVAQAEAAVASAQAQVASRQAELVRAQAQSSEVSAPPRAVDVAALIAAANEAHARLSAASVRLTYTQIVSPIDGVVTDIAFDPGEQITAGTSVVTVQTADQNQFKIVVDVAEADIAKVSAGDAASVTFDAFGEDEVVAGSVADIDPAEKLIEGVVFYEVTVYLDAATSGLALKPGMSADVTITTDVRPNTLSVPQRAVLEHDDGTKYVRLPGDGDAFEERVVETGLRGDGGRVEILSGLEEGDVFVLSVRD